ncbi:MAG: S24 family peptidase [Cypionkella sp.]
MDSDGSPFAEMIRQRLKALNTNAFAVEQSAGLPPDAIRNVIRSKKKDGPTLARAKEICDALGLTFDVGTARVPMQIAHVTIDGADFASIPLHEAYLSAGPGSSNGDEVAIIDHLVFRQEWLRKIGVKPAEAAMARISGDSMAPGIQNGDLVMIDRSRCEVPLRKPSRKPHQLPIFAFMQDQEARVKRLERLAKERILILYSDNKELAPEVLAESDAHTINILGQVVWSGHVWR